MDSLYVTTYPNIHFLVTFDCFKHRGLLSNDAAVSEIYGRREAILIIILQYCRSSHLKALMSEGLRQILLAKSKDEIFSDRDYA